MSAVLDRSSEQETAARQAAAFQPSENSMSEPITITATVAAWLPEWNKPHQLVERLQAGDGVKVVNSLHLYGPPSMKDFGKYVRVGDATITLTLLPQDDQVRLAVEGLKRQIEEARAAWLEKQRELMDEISKLQAITYQPEAA